MFDVSWVDPARQTVGQRKTRKVHSTTASRRSSFHSSNSTESPPNKTKPSFLNLFGGAKSSSLTRTGSHPKLSALRVQDDTKETRRLSSFTAASETSTQEFTGAAAATRRFPANGFFTGSPYHSDEQSALSEGMFVRLHRWPISHECSV